MRVTGLTEQSPQQPVRVLVDSLRRTWRSKQPPAPSAATPERFRRAFEHAGVALALVGPDDRLLHCNAALCRLTGYGMHELGALTVADLAHPEDREDVRAERRAVEAGQVQAATRATRVVRPDGHTVWASVGYSSAQDGSPGELIVQMVDVTERTRAERELTRSNAELSSFAYLAAHELKSPLQTLSGFASLLERTYGPQLDPRARELVSWIVDGAARMDSLVEDLLAYCSVDTAEAVSAAVSLDDVLAAALGQLDGEVAARGASVQAGPLPVLAGDPVQLGQLLQNLLANALKFVPDGRPPEVHVSADRATDGWTVTVADNGIGVEEAARERIFSMFERLHPRERYQGTGIGLSVCKRIIERRGGTIWVEPRPGGGSRFRFSVPDIVSPVSSLPAA